MIPLPGAGAAPGPAPAEPVSEAAEEETAPELVVLDGMGVIFEEGDDIRKLLVPYARERGCTLEVDEIVGSYGSGYRPVAWSPTSRSASCTPPTRCMPCRPCSSRCGAP